MTETPFLPLLNRDEAQSIVSQHFGPQVALLTELTNYASNLIPRAYKSSDQQLRDLIVCYSLLKQFASMLDAVDVLVRAGSIQAAMTPARVAFEASLYIEWMLVADGARKAVHYFVGNVRAEREWARRVSRGTPQAAEFLADMGQLGADILDRAPALDTEAAHHIAQIDKILSRSEYAPIDRAFEALKKRRRRPYDPSWYEVLGKSSVRQIAKELHRLPDYIVYYGEGSRVVHSASYSEHIKFKMKGATARPIRDLSKISTVLNFVLATALQLFIRVLGFYRPRELPAFGRQYIRDWRAAYTSIPKVVVAGEWTPEVR